MATNNSSVPATDARRSINDKLPREVMEQILARLSVPDLLRCMTVNKLWEGMITDVLKSRKELVISPWVCGEPDVRGFSRALSLCSSLTHLDIRERDVVQDAASVVPTLATSAVCKQLKVLKLRRIRLTVPVSVVLAARLTSLEHLEAAACDLTDLFITVLFAGSERLTALDVRENNHISSRPFINTPAGLEKLIIRECRAVGDDIFSKLLARCAASLLYLDVGSCWSLTVACNKFTPLARLSKLRVLNLDHTRCIHDQDITYIVTGCTQLEELRIHGNSNSCLTSSGLKQLGLARNLVELDVGNQAGVDDTCVEAFATLPRLRTLSMAACSNVTAAGLMPLAQCTALTQLDISLNPHIDDIRVLQAFRDTSKALWVMMVCTGLASVYKTLTVEEKATYMNNNVYVIA